MTGSTLEITPRSIRGAVSNAEPTTPTHPADLPPVLGFTAVGQAFRRATQPDYFRWLDHVRPAAGCTRPIRLSGHLDTVYPATGQPISRLSTVDMPDGVIYKACGNRRATICPSCARTYQRDAYQLLRAGLVGGKGVPESVAEHPANFATFTAPSFGTVHTRTVTRHTCRDRRRCDCRPEPCHPRRDTGLCRHGQPAVCWVRHEPTHPRLGQPLCLDCYDHDHQVVWNHFAGQLWHRTKQAIERHLAVLAWKRRISPVLVTSASGRLREVPPVRVSHGKVGEFQTRGAIHFHALLRLDGVDPDDPDAIVPPPDAITGTDLEAAIRYAANQVAFSTPTHPDQPAGWRIGWGEQVDPRPITLTGHGEVTDTMAAGYLAKYATKSTEPTGHQSARLTAENVDQYTDPDGDHIARLIDACWRLGQPHGTPTPLAQRPDRPRPATRFRPRRTCPGCGTTTRLRHCPQCTTTGQPGPVDTYVSKPDRSNPYQGLRRWAHMLGFGGHFLTKARRYSVTFATLRGTRISYRRTQTPGHPEAIRAVDITDQDTTLIIGVLSYAGTGWHTTGDALLANTAAALARERQATGREELAHETGTHRNTLPTAA